MISTQSFEVTVIDIFIDYIDYTCIRDGKDYEYETYVIIIETQLLCNEIRILQIFNK